MSTESIIDKTIEDARAIDAEDWQVELVNQVMTSALGYAKKNDQPVGRSFAAAFDLIVAAHYYGNIANRGWLYCGPEKPILLYPYTNTCPRCAIKNEFYFHKSNKPRSGNIGSVTSLYLCLCYQWFFKHTSFSNLKILIGREPVDVLVVDEDNKSCFLAEIKASPLVIFPLAAHSDQLTEENEGGRQETDSHQEVTIARVSQVDLFVLLPSKTGGSNLVKLGRRLADRDGHWAANAIRDLCKNSDFFGSFYEGWSEAFGKYCGESSSDGSYWLTNSCGAPNPMPTTWPRRSSGTGYETISDNKTSVGMDRTDDIKKGTYQVLKIGSVAKFPKEEAWNVTVGLVSNIHAVQHFTDYLASLSDVVWTKAGDQIVKKAADLPPDTDIENLFDGIISFTSSNIRDRGLANIFKFENAELQ